MAYFVIAMFVSTSMKENIAGCCLCCITFQQEGRGREKSFTITYCFNHKAGNGVFKLLERDFLWLWEVCAKDIRRSVESLFQERHGRWEHLLSLKNLVSV